MTGRVVVVGGGITGLVAARELARSPSRPSVTLVEAGDRLGGKVRTSTVAGMPVDEAPDAFLARVPEAADLCRDLGLGDRLVAPAQRSALVWSRGALRPLPDGHVLGVPTDLAALARSGVVSRAGVARAALDRVLPGRPLVGDEPVGALVRRRLGAEVLARLVDPLVGGINAGDSDRLSVAAVTPQLAEAAREGGSLVAALARRPAADPTAPVFLSLDGGLQQLTDALAADLAATGVDVRLRWPVAAVDRAPGGGWVVHGDGGTGDPLGADAVVVTCAAHTAARLLAGAAPAAARALCAVEHASVVLVAFAYDRAAIPGPLDASGFLVPRCEHLLLTACSWASSKWAHLGGGPVLLRASAGRHGDDTASAMDEDRLVERLAADLATTMGVRGRPVDVRVGRWPASFPQYAPGHLDRVAALEANLAATAPGLVVAGAALRGLGLPACVRQGRAAAAAALRAATAGADVDVRA